MDDRQQIPAVNVVEHIERAVERSMKIVDPRRIDGRVWPAMGNNTDVIDPPGTNNPFVGVRDKTAIVRR